MLTTNSKHRRLWTSEEDQALIYLKDQLKMKKWTQIAKKMLSMFNLEGRTQKQCRDRFHYLVTQICELLKKCLEIICLDLSRLNQTLLALLRAGQQMVLNCGLFSQNVFLQLNFRNGIFIKNKFYSRLRRAIRHLNLIVEKYFSEQEKPFQFGIIFKLVNNANHKNDPNLCHQIKEILELNPKFFEDVIVKIIKMTHDDSNYVLKKRKLQRFNFKDEIMWKKLIQILRYLQKQSCQAQLNVHFEKDFHLQTHHNHYEGQKYTFSQQIQDFLKHTIQPEEKLIKQNNQQKKSNEASYIQLNNINELMNKRQNCIFIISNQRFFDQKKKQCQNHICEKILLKTDEVSQNKQNNMCCLQKKIYLKYDSIVLAENNLKMVAFEEEEDNIIHM